MARSLTGLNTLLESSFPSFRLCLLCFVFPLSIALSSTPYVLLAETWWQWSLALGIPRVPLGPLDPDWDLNTSQSLRSRYPTIFYHENVDIAVNNVLNDTNNIVEVVSLTDNCGFNHAATPNEPLDSDEEALVESPSGRNQILQDQSSSGDESSDDGVDEDDYEMISTEVLEEELAEENIDEQDDEEDEANMVDEIPVTFFDPTAMGLKEINNLAHFGVSSHKPGNGVKELLSEDLDKYWQ